MKDRNRTASIVRGAGPWKLTSMWVRWNGLIDWQKVEVQLVDGRLARVRTPSDRPATFAGGTNLPAGCKLKPKAGSQASNHACKKGWRKKEQEKGFPICACRLQ
ncbi:hypothetical protein SETIT_3G055900v2 [Setaria italica]|uniref:Uncharacterized protein n=2 Tax=Setaria TaxID=4554 RepID=A0A368QBS7_SETIT|nr:hypothetical protein SETIT_3G055900v2 [Setaria italica]TKW24530.1 hypothetical protein SEVIR_3G056700v2 [Setaria viridis]